MPTTTGQEPKNVNVTTLKGWLDKDEAVLVDVREPAEHAGERIPGSHLVPLSTFDPARVPQEPGKKLVLHCVMGARSAQAGQQLLAAGVVEVWNLQGGIQAWKDAGYETLRGARAPLSLERQVRIVAGSLVLLGTLLGAFVSPWFLLLSGFIGAGFIVSGLTGSCGMAMLLTRLPYNQRVSATS
jgi:rhodanese-related sulfurtransferase